MNSDGINWIATSNKNSLTFTSANQRSYCHETVFCGSINISHKEACYGKYLFFVKCSFFVSPNIIISVTGTWFVRIIL